MAKNPVAANLLMVMLIVIGLMVSFNLRKEVFPQISLDQVSVSVAYPGASPAEVEQGILLVVEEAVRSLDGVKEVHSTASEGIGTVAIELRVGTDRDKALADVKNTIDRITSLPKEAERPQVRIPEIKSQAISLVLYGDQKEKILRTVAERVREELLQLPEITQVDLKGIRPLEIGIEVSQQTLRSYNLTLQQIAGQVRRTAIEMPAGSVNTKDGDILLRTTERRNLGVDFANIPIVFGGDTDPVKLGDLATIRDGFAETDVYAYFNGKPAVYLNVFSVGDQSPTDTGMAVKQYAKNLHQRLPPGITATTWKDRTELFEQRVDLLLGNAMIGLAVVLVILGLFLEIRLAFWVSMGIPISFLGSIILLPVFGVSLNMISMFAFLVTLGMVVDDAIVVGENIFRLRSRGVPLLKAAILGAKEVATPVFFSIATTMAAFSPLLFVPGAHGKITVCIPIIVILVLFISLIESFFVLPSHLGHRFINKENRFLSPVFNLQKRFSKLVERFIERVYRPLVVVTIHYRWIVVAVSIAIFLVTTGLVSGGKVKFIDFPKEETDWATAQITLPYDVSIDKTRTVMQKLVNSALKVIEKNGGSKVSRGVFSTIGASSGISGPRSRTSATGSNITSVTVAFVPIDQRPFSSFGFIEKWRAELGIIGGIDTISFSSTMRGSTKPIDLEISHQDIEVLETISARVANHLARFEGVFDIDNGIELGKPQLDFTLTEAGINAGLTSLDLASQVRSSFYGSEVLRQQRGRNEVKVMVRLPRKERESIYSLEEMIIRTPNGGEIPLKQAARVHRGRAYNSISRTDGKRTIRVKADVKEDKANPREVVASLYKNVTPKLLRNNHGLSFEVSGRQKGMKDFFSYMITGFAIALIAIYGLLAIPLRSYLQPIFVVMAAIPFGYVGAVFGHLIMGMDLSIFSILGIVALAGVVVNDSIVFVHTANGFRNQGIPVIEAISNAAQQRFRPIILTTLTTFGGLAPIIFETSFQARMIIPMAVSLGFGIIFSTFFVLFLIPSLFVIIENLRLWLKQ